MRPCMRVLWRSGLTRPLPLSPPARPPRTRSGGSARMMFSMLPSTAHWDPTATQEYVPYTQQWTGACPHCPAGYYAQDSYPTFGGMAPQVSLSHTHTHAADTHRALRRCPARSRVLSCRALRTPTSACTTTGAPSPPRCVCCTRARAQGMRCFSRGAEAACRGGRSGTPMPQVGGRCVGGRCVRICRRRPVAHASSGHGRRGPREHGEKGSHHAREGWRTRRGPWTRKEQEQFAGRQRPRAGRGRRSRLGSCMLRCGMGSDPRRRRRRRRRRR